VTSDDQSLGAGADGASVPPWLRLGKGYLTVEIKARPGSRKRGLLRTLPTGPVVALVAVPEKGRANRELIEFIAEVLGVSPMALSIVKGQSARQKLIRVETAAPQALGAKLLNWCK
jgi:uncharacterized protein YggU (UPF0235/DUF167 family)